MREGNARVRDFLFTELPFCAITDSRIALFKSFVACTSNTVTVCVHEHIHLYMYISTHIQSVSL